jgi:Bbp16
MITDINMRVSDAQAVTVTAVSTNSVDTAPNAPSGQIFSMMDAGAPIFLVITVNTPITTPAAGTVAFEFITSAAATLTSPQVLATTEVFPDEDILAAMGPIVLVPSPDVKNNQGHWLRYFGVRYVCATALPAGATFTADFVEAYSDGHRFHKSGFDIA